MVTCLGAKLNNQNLLAALSLGRTYRLERQSRAPFSENVLKTSSVLF
jgi:hypothetical protein